MCLVTAFRYFKMKSSHEPWATSFGRKITISRREKVLVCSKAVASDLDILDLTIEKDLFLYLTNHVIDMYWVALELITSSKCYRFWREEIVQYGNSPVYGANNHLGLWNNVHKTIVGQFVFCTVTFTVLVIFLRNWLNQVTQILWIRHIFLDCSSNISHPILFLQIHPSLYLLCYNWFH